MKRCKTCKKELHNQEIFYCKRCKNKYIREKEKIRREAKELIKNKEDIKKGDKVGSFNLTKVEQEVLFRKYVLEIGIEEASKKVKKIKEYLKNLVMKLRKKNVSEGDITARFREEFSKLLSGG